ncbi:hypothetical protein AB833_12795 [Chromatiales bacterium (ex Bugula neritina AB1)]|nr:hypothetical protein AB833_12795 [Chromatiales bacterium (ex Bugula neritina AB1)]
MQVPNSLFRNGRHSVELASAGTETNYIPFPTNTITLLPQHFPAQQLNLPFAVMFPAMKSIYVE